MSMRFRNSLISSAVAAAIGSAAPALVMAQAAADQAAPAQTGKPVQLEEVIVTGIRASLQGAMDLKRNSDTIQDSIVAEDIGKLPDVTAVEALQRITGIQIGRDLGEGGGTVTIGGSAVNSGFQVRGLPQVATTLNGREVFTATGSRVLNFEDIPSSLLAGIDVYKDPTANLLEGGIGATVDLRTRKPFDFKGFELEASAADRYGDLAKKAKPEFNALVSDRWDTGIGELGGLLSVGFQDRAYREDQTTQAAILTSATAIPGQTTTLLSGTYNTMFVGERKRYGFDGVLQWQAASDLQFYAEGSSQEFKWQQNQYSFQSTGTAATLVPGSVTTFPGTTDANATSYANPVINAIGAWRNLLNLDRQFALNGKWTPGSLTVVGDVSYTKSTELLVNPAVVLGANVPGLRQTASIGGVPQTTVTGVDLTNLANYTNAANTYTYDTEQHFKGAEKAVKFDVDYSIGNGFLTSVSAGVRYADRTLRFDQFTAFGSISAANLAATSGWFGPTPFSNLFSETESNAVEPKFITFNPDQLHYNLPGVLSTYGVKPVAATPTQDYSAEEKNKAGYLRANFEADVGVPMDGNVGVRVARVEEYLSGVTGAALSPLTFSSATTSPLPSLNLRFKLRDDLQMRLAASKVVNYPDFTLIKPTISLLPIQQSATGGNPYLKPQKANQLDGTLEWYFAPASSLTVDVFYKKLQNFIFQTTTQGAFTVNGVTYNLTGPASGPSGTIKGAEFGYQQFFDFLPGLWSGLGAQLNYTYVDATAPTAVAGTTTTLPGLSKNSFNLIGMYEKGPVSFRLAYSWRSQFYTTIYTGNTAQLAANPVFTKGFGWLDSSFTYDVTDQWSAYVQGSNLLRTRIDTFYGAETRPNGRTIDDRQYLVGVRFKF